MAQKVLDALNATFGDAIEATAVQHGDEIAYIKASQLVSVATWLRDEPSMAFDAPVFVTAIDRMDWHGATAPDGTALELDADGELLHRFEVCFQLRSSAHRYRIRLKVRASAAAPNVPSLAGLWSAFDWQERETFDMYGIIFEGHPDLRRIYLYDEFIGHPLRKDYPKDKRQPLVRRDDLVSNPVRKGALDG